MHEGKFDRLRILQKAVPARKRGAFYFQIQMTSLKQEVNLHVHKTFGFSIENSLSQIKNPFPMLLTKFSGFEVIEQTYIRDNNFSR